jgi:hypothetical protein
MQAAIERMKRDTQAVTDIAATFLFYHIRVVGTKRLLVDGQGAVDTSAALYAFLFSIALETAAMFAMMVAYSTPKVVTALLRHRQAYCRSLRRSRHNKVRSAKKRSPRMSWRWCQVIRQPVSVGAMARASTALQCCQ